MNLDKIGYGENPDKVKVLLGNHDFHYLPNIFESY